MASSILRASIRLAMPDISGLQLKPNMALFLDFDGTLAPICDDPESVGLSKDDANLLIDCANFLGGALAIISGRDLRDLAARVPSGLWRSGNHGLFIAAPGKTVPPDLPSLPSALAEAMETLIRDMDGVWLERKGPVAAIHFRAAPQHEADILTGTDKLLKRFSEYKRQHGNMIVEAKPMDANKGSFIHRQMAKPIFSGRIPFMIGDDTTDEDAFAAVQDLGGLAVKVGPGESCAAYRAATIADVYSFLRSAL